MASDTVVFHLKRDWPCCKGMKRLYDLIKDGTKTSEWRQDTPRWTKMLLINDPKHAVFVEGYPKGNMPRLEADITRKIHHKRLHLIETQFRNVHEIK